MSDISEKMTMKPFLIWLLLIGLTCTSFALFEQHVPVHISGTVLILIAGIKSRLVIIHYMEAKRASARWRLMYETWNFTCVALIVIANMVTLFPKS